MSSTLTAMVPQIPFAIVLPEPLEWTTRPHQPGRTGAPRGRTAGLDPVQRYARECVALRARRPRELAGEDHERLLVIGMNMTSTPSMYLGEPPEPHVVPVGGIVHVRPGTPLQSVNETSEDLLVYAYGSPPDEGAEVLVSAV